MFWPLFQPERKFQYLQNRIGFGYYLKKSIKLLQSNGNDELPSVLPTPRAVRSHTVRTLANWLVLSSRDSRAIDFRLKSRVSTPEITFREKLIFQCLFD